MKYQKFQIITFSIMGKNQEKSLFILLTQRDIDYKMLKL